jgi:thiamine-monophosphate kinase
MNELRIIDLIRETFASQKADLLDDVSFIKRGEGYIVFKTDMLVKSTDIPRGMTLRQASRKAVVACLSDMLCKGADLWGFMISLGIPKLLATEENVTLLSLGLMDASVQYEIPILGGDVNEADDLVIAVAVAGYARRMVRRDGAKVGDRLVATGPFGLTALGLGHLLGGKPLPRSLAASSLSSVYEPSPRKGLCKLLIDGGVVNASMDSSDGLAMTLNEMSRQSGREMVMTSLPAEPAFLRACSSAGLDALDLVLHGGEEYEAVLAVPEAKLPTAISLAAEAGARLYPFGIVRRGKARVLYSPPGSSPATEIPADGWVHLQ